MDPTKRALLANLIEARAEIRCRNAHGLAKSRPRPLRQPIQGSSGYFQAFAKELPVIISKNEAKAVNTGSNFRLICCLSTLSRPPRTTKYGPGSTSVAGTLGGVR